MSSFFGKLKSNTESRNPSANSPSKSKKDDLNAPVSTPLERMLETAGPIRDDGSDKFWGMENFGNTCYCNSILQALYFSVPFRENILSYPARSSPESIQIAAQNGPPRPKYPPKSQPPPARPNVIVPQSQQKQEDKESPEYKKKQALLAGPIMNLSYENARTYDMPDSLYSSVKDVFEGIVDSRERRGIVSPSKLVEVLRRDNEMFRGQLHQDAHEFFNLLLNTLSDNIDEKEKSRIKAEEGRKLMNDSTTTTEKGNSMVTFPSFLPETAPQPSKWLRDMFEGQLTSETRCLTCETISQRDEPFLDLSVDLEQHTSVTSCLRRFSEEEMLCERNKFHCDNCGGLQEAEKRMKIKKLPRLLTLHLKRFKYTEDFNRLQKLFHKVVYPYHLRLFNTTDDAEDPDRLYELYAVVVHIGGGPFHGHYVSVIKTEDRGWLLFDDEMVEPVDKSYVQNFFGDKSGLATAYVLFYQETTTEKIRVEERREGKSRASTAVPEMSSLRAQEAAHLHQVRSPGPTSPLEHSESSLNNTLKSPSAAMNGHLPIPGSPLPGTNPFDDSTLTTPKSRKENDRDTKLSSKLEQAVHTNAVPLQQVLENTKRSAAEQFQQNQQQPVSLANGGLLPSNVDTNGATAVSKEESKMSSFLSRSKSLRFGSSIKKDRKSFLGINTNMNSNNNTENEKAVVEETQDSSALEDGANTTSHAANPNMAAIATEEKRKNRFSLRKKSFGKLHS